jgi:diguanylate cyclase (GGDEF)-like protein
MDPLVTTFVNLRRKTRDAVPVVGALLLAVVVALHAAQPLDTRLFGVAVAMLVALIAVRAWQRRSAVEPSMWLEVELGALLTVAAFASVVHLDGALDGRFYPLVLLAIGVVSALARPLSALIVIGLMAGYETLIWQLSGDRLELDHLLPHIGFALAFGLLNAMSLRLEVARLRRASHSELAAERDRIREDARSYRLLRAPSDVVAPASRAQDEERLMRSGVEEIQLSLLFALQLLRASLKVHTAILLWLTADGDRLRIAELVSDAPDLAEGPFAAGDGILGAVLDRGNPVRVDALKQSYVLPYYREACPVDAVCAVPVYEHGALRGVLVVDRVQEQAFSDAEQRLVEQASRFAARIIENERVFVQLERTKVEQGKLYRAAERLGAAMTEQEVVDAGVNSAREIAAVDFAALTSFDDDSDSHRIRAVSGEGAEQLVDECFDSNRGLVSMALRNRHPLPYRGQYDRSHQVVFDKHLSPPEVPSLLVLPLVVHDEPLGTLVLASEREGAFDETARGLLEVLASHLAVSLANARMVRRLEEQATTDPMTGLLNKRSMLDTAQQKLTAARRFGRQLSVLVIDIDHFKKVNDTYGHDVGDVVIKELGQICNRNKRSTDAVARFGGEEFVVICEETDSEGAMLLAERIRGELGRTSFHANGETLQCTCSVGISTFPHAGEGWDTLFKAADDALYVSKRGGRNRATIYDPKRAA